MIRVGINGFGRIGRQVMRQSIGRDDLAVVAVNDLWDPAVFAHLLRHDSTYGAFPHEVRVSEEGLSIGGRNVVFTSHRDPGEIPWGQREVDVVVEATGLFRDRTQAERHRNPGGARKVIISAPAKDPDLTVVMGVNSDAYQSEKHHVISNASCTTNCLAPLAKVLNDAFQIESGMMNTIHAYTSDQQLLDGPHKDLRRARSAAINMIPTSTGAAVAVGDVLPELDGKLDGFSVRVPTPTVSLLDFTAICRRPVTAETVNEALSNASRTSLAGVLAVTEEPLVSSDYVGSEYSAVVDLTLTQAVGEQMVKVVAWYDNEMGYATRVVDLIEWITRT